MKIRFSFISLIIGMFGFLNTSLKAQSSIILQLKNESEQVFDISTIRKITFSDESFIFNYREGNTASYALESIMKVMFTVPTSADQLLTLEKKVDFFPNPAKEHLYIQSEEKYVNLFILSMEGKIIATYNQYPVGEALYIGGLPTGFYLIKVNHQTLKLHKL